ncbi:MAG: lipoprotein-releasing ABC transporter permease subunit [Betaproteobacteria bacterium]|nr:lipoprotein-releasing ABC transporter permease subunit [Betaproteobacteria bacterium]
MHPFELFVGLRYTRAKRRNRFISFISAISVVGMALGITVLITVMSVMNGFQREIRTRILEATSHVEIMGARGGLEDWQKVAGEAAAHPEVIAAAPYVNSQGLLSFGQAVKGTVVRGILPEYEAKVVEIGKHMKQGGLEALTPDGFGIILGVDLARALGVAIGDKVTLIAPQGQVTPAGVMPRLKQFTVAGIFELGHFEYDAGLALVHMADAQKLYRLERRVSGVRLKLKNLFEARRVARELSRLVSAEAYIGDWTRFHANFYRAVEIEKRMMFLVVVLIVAVAAFNIVSTMVMAVTEKQADIAILRTLGGSPRSIMKIFIVQGSFIGVLGTALGIAGGIALALNVDTAVAALEQVLGFKFLSKDVYYISELPSELQWADVIITAVVSFALSLLATVYPSYRASRVNPAEALRYE